MSYAICFDFPSFPGEPYFATGADPKDNKAIWTVSLGEAKKFDSEAEAERFLGGMWQKEYGAVVEMGE